MNIMQISTGLEAQNIHGYLTDTTAGASGTAIYLYIGMDRARGTGTWPDFDQHGGHIGVMDWIASFAPVVDAFYENDQREYPGVASYEVTEEMGSWLYFHNEATKEEFAAELCQFVDAWIAGQSQ